MRRERGWQSRSKFMINNIIIVVAVVLGGYLAFSKRPSKSSSWQATVTPLASIMGCGFLVARHWDRRQPGGRLHGRLVIVGFYAVGGVM